MANPVRQVSDIIASVAGQLTGVDLTEVTNLNGALERAARIMFQKAKMPEAVGRLFFSLYSGVYDYPADPSMFGTSILDLRPQGASRNPLDYVYKDNIADFDRLKQFTRNGYACTFEYVNGAPIIRASTPRTVTQAIIDPMNATTGWVAGGNASNLALDSTFYYQQPGSLSLSLAAAGSQGYIEKTLTSSLDLSGYQQPGMLFLALEMPTVDFTSVTVRIGTSSTVYYEGTVTAPFLGSFAAGQFQIVAVPMSSMVAHGGITTMKGIQYARVLLNYDGTAMANVRLGGLWASLPSPVELLYSTAGIFLNSTTGLLSQKISSPNDYIVLSDAAWSIYELESAVQVVNQSGGSLSSGIVAGINAQLNGARARNGQIIELGLYDLYRADNPTQEIHTIGNWYND